MQNQNETLLDCANDMISETSSSTLHNYYSWAQTMDAKCR